MSVKIRKVGNSTVVTIPDEALSASKLSAGSVVEVTGRNGVISIKRAKNEITMDDIFKEWEGKYEPEEIDWGPPVGNEVW